MIFFSLAYNFIPCVPITFSLFVVVQYIYEKKDIKVVTNDILSAPALKKFKHLSAIVESTSTSQTLSSFRSQLEHYLMDLKQQTNTNALKYWINHQATYGLAVWQKWLLTFWQHQPHRLMGKEYFLFVECSVKVDETEYQYC